MMDPPDVSDGINERVSVSGAQRNRFAGIRLLSGPEKRKSRDRTTVSWHSSVAASADLVLSRLSGDLLRVPIGSVMYRAYLVFEPPLWRASL